MLMGEGLAPPRRPSLVELGEAVGRAILRQPADLLADGALDTIGAAGILHFDPLVLYMCGGSRRTLGMPGAGVALLRKVRTIFLMANYGSIENPHPARGLRYGAILHRWRWPKHDFIFLTNTAKEAERLGSLGETAILLNHNLTVPEEDFYPLEGEPRFDAVYNARLHPQKRHELSILVARCAMIFMHTSMESAAYEQELIARHNREAPGHQFINEFRDGVPVSLGAAEVNLVYNQAAVGLALSKVEGAMFSSMEYLLAGLPVVSTPNVGGRDLYFDDEFCITVEPDPRAVRDAVAALKDRKIPRHYIRAKTLEKVERDRVRFRALLCAVIERNGGSAPSIEGWPFASKLLTWKPWSEHFADIRAKRLTAFKRLDAPT